MRQEIKAGVDYSLVLRTSHPSKSGRGETLSSIAPLSSSFPLVLAVFPLSLSTFTLLLVCYIRPCPPLSLSLPLSSLLCCMRLLSLTVLSLSHFLPFFYFRFLFLTLFLAPVFRFYLNFYYCILRIHFTDISPLAFSLLLPPRPLAIIFLFVLNALFIIVPFTSPFKYHDERFHSSCISNLNFYEITPPF